MVVFVIPDGRGGNTPDVSVQAIFSPARLIGLHRWTRTEGGLEIIEHRLGMRDEAVEDLNDLSNAHLNPVQRVQQRANLPHGQTHHRAQGGNQTGQSHPNAPLTQHRCVEIHRRFMPFLTPRTPTFEDAMFGDFHWDRSRKINHFSATSQADASQPQITRRAHRKMMFHDVRRYRSATRLIVLTCALLAWLVLFGCWLWNIGFHES